MEMVQTATLLGTQALGVVVCSEPDCIKGRIVCETVYGDMYFKDLLG